MAHLIFVDHHHTPTHSEIEAAVQHARRKRARAIRTSAMFPDAADAVRHEGFVTIDRLALLHIDLDAPPRHATHALGSTSNPASASTEPDLVTRDRPARIAPMRLWHLAPCSKIDRDSFGLMWGNTPTSLRDIRSATPWNRSSIARERGDVVGFAISGAAADTGYLQRLAVTPDRRRSGIALELVDDAFEWMRRRGLQQALVNTGVSNHPALALYDSIGFSRLDDELTIAELKLG